MKMDLEEAQRRVEGCLRIAGYAPSQGAKWTLKYNLDDPEDIWTLSLDGFSYMRAVLVNDANGWVGMLALKVGERGEFPLSIGPILREEAKDHKFWKPPNAGRAEFLNRIVRVTMSLGRWDREKAYPEVLHAMVKVALLFKRGGHQRRGWRVILAADRGDLSECYISEALSIAQYQWAATYTERAWMAHIWEEVFR